MSITASDLLDVQSVASDPPPALVDGLRAIIRADAQDAAQTQALVTDEVTEEVLLAALVAVVPEALERHVAQGIVAEATAAGLRDVGRKARAYGVRTVLPWVLSILRGDVIELGRLQVERVPGPNGYGLHIPEGGPLTADVVSDSLARIRTVLGDVPLVCSSWILDPALQEDLPTGNLAAFARRFAIEVADDPNAGSGSDAVVKFVFHRPLAEVMDEDAVVPTTSLERAVARRLRSGYLWTQPIGRLVEG